MSSPQRSPRLVLIMGVAGSGKTTIGRRLAAELDWEYFEADEFHPPANIEKMSRGEPLNDADRAPWLASIRSRMNRCLAEGRPGVFTCSALKTAYRHVLAGGMQDLLAVYLSADARTIEQRVGQRSGHFMKMEMVRSQFAALEPPEDALVIDAQAEPDVIVRLIRAALLS